MATTEELLTKLLQVAEDQLRWQRATGLPQVRETVYSALSKTQQRRAYELCDGTRTNRQVAAAVRASEATLSRWASGWRDLGIAYETPEGKTRHLLSLDALDLPVEVRDDSGGGQRMRG
jgi:hypothetical protein